jgi:hypothetical protein
VTAADDIAALKAQRDALLKANRKEAKKWAAHIRAKVRRDPSWSVESKACWFEKCVEEGDDPDQNPLMLIAELRGPDKTERLMKTIDPNDFLPRVYKLLERTHKLQKLFPGLIK